MRYFWLIVRLVFCPLTILFIYLTVTEPSGEKKEKGSNMQIELEVISLKTARFEKMFKV